ncbi:MAG: sulfite exporter TauE/SafE family protein [Pseudomonadota bacterium]
MTGLESDPTQLAWLVVMLMSAGLAAGFAAGLFGIGGGFVVVPALLLVFNYFGVEREIMTHVAIGTSLATIIITSLSSVRAHAKHDAVDFKIIREWAPGLIMGVMFGLGLARLMDGQSMKWVFSAGVLLLGLHFIFPILQRKPPVATEMPHGPVMVGISTFLGGFSALLGIGGGTIAILVMTAHGRSIHQAVATAAGFGVVIAIPGAIGFVLLGLGQDTLPYGSVGYVNFLAVAAITAMSFLTAPLGAKVAHSLDGVMLKRVFGIYLVATSLTVLRDSFVV